MCQLSLQRKMEKWLVRGRFNKGGLLAKYYIMLFKQTSIYVFFPDEIKS